MSIILDIGCKMPQLSIIAVQWREREREKNEHYRSDELGSKETASQRQSETNFLRCTAKGRREKNKRESIISPRACKLVDKKQKKHPHATEYIYLARSLEHHNHTSMRTLTDDWLENNDEGKLDASIDGWIMLEETVLVILRLSSDQWNLLESISRFWFDHLDHWTGRWRIFEKRGIEEDLQRVSSRLTRWVQRSCSRS